MKIRKTKTTTPTLPPLVVRQGWEGNVARWRAIAAELAPVIAIMDRLGLTAAGFKLAREHEASVSTYGTITNRGELERLTLAREAIREAAKEAGTFWTLPNALLCWHGVVVELYGDRGPGKAWEYAAQHSGPVRLVAVGGLEGEEWRWQLAA